ncbi:MAG: YeeE/YedE thiosulfate transporter family protein [Ancalomicrobiaceae bacterium]|nr:YeeE/YedE thiosulfate transporter family protein [Ancalomicrobiaceae bacterium]
MTDQTAVPGSSPLPLLALLKRQSAFQSVFVQPWSYITGGVLLAVVASALLQSTGSVWGVTTALTYWGAWAWGLVGGDPHSWAYFHEVSHGLAFNKPGLNILNHAGSVVDLGLIFGALASALLASQFKIKAIKSGRQATAAILGGLLMGFGARLSFGCNIGALFSGLPSMSLHGWVFMLFIFIGAIIGSKLLVTLFIGAPKLSTSAPAATVAAAATVASPAPAGGGIKRIQRTRAAKKENVIQFPLGVALVIGLAIVGVIYGNVMHSPVLAATWGIGIAFGFILQRSRFCFTAAMRDPVLTGGTNLTKAVVVALAVSTALIAAAQIGAYVKGGSMDAAMKVGGFGPVGIWTAVGATLFGMGAVISGGCASGTLMRVGEGFLQQWLVLPFFCIGGAIGAATWPIWGPGLAVDQSQVIYLPNVLGGFFPALIAQFVALAAVWLLADWWAKRPART